MPTAPAKPLKLFKPETLWPAAKEEVFFGSGTYTIGVPGKHATLLMKCWSEHFRDHKLGTMFRASYDNQFRTAIRITRSSEFEAALKRAGYTLSSLSLPMPEDAQAQLLRQVAAVIANPALTFEEV